MREHDESLQVDARGPGHVGPGAKIMARANQTRKNKTARKTGSDRKLLFLDRWVVHGTGEKDEDDAERGDVGDLISPVATSVNRQVTFVEQGATQTQNVNGNVELKRFCRDHSKRPLFDHFQESKNEPKKLNHTR